MTTIIRHQQTFIAKEQRKQSFATIFLCVSLFLCGKTVCGKINNYNYYNSTSSSIYRIDDGNSRIFLCLNAIHRHNLGMND